MNITIYIVGVLLSSLVTVSILIDFMDKVFERTYKNKLVYIALITIFILILGGVNTINNGWLNMLTVVAFEVFICTKMYTGNRNKKLVYNTILCICMGACESIGIALISFIYNFFNMTIPSEKMISFYNLTITQIIVIIIYHLVLYQLLRKKEISDLTIGQYLFSFAFALFSLINVYILSVLLRDTSSGYEIILVMVTMVGIVIINTHFLNILQYASENKQLQYENHLFLQQSRMQYTYYDKLEQQYRESLSIIHDANKHIRAIEELYRHQEIETATKYTKDISNILNSFKINEYTENKVLNIIINDKLRIAEQRKIKLICKIDYLDLNFIDNVDLTTIFANLLDNAIEACNDLLGEKVIILQVGAFHNLIIINIKNSIEEILGEVGIDMKSSKKNHEGIGIPNVKKVVSKYNGDFSIQRIGNMFVCNIVLSKQGMLVKHVG